MSQEPKLYRSRTGIVLGVCEGIARWRELPVAWVRIFFVILFLCTGGLPAMMLYFLATLFMQPEPLNKKTRDGDTIDI